MLDALDNKLNDVWKNSILYSRVEPHTAVINNEMSIVLQNFKNSVTVQKEGEVGFFIYIYTYIYLMGKSHLKLEVWLI